MGNKLLLADDSITIQKVVGIIFANEDYELTVVDNGTAALEKARLIKPDVILVDALMPGKSGYEVCAEVRQDAALKGTPILLLTGAFEPFDEEKAKQCGADDYISKPFESQQLIDRVKNLVELGKNRSVTSPVKEMPIGIVPPAPASSESIWDELPELPVASEPFTEFSREPAAADVEEAFSQVDEMPAAVAPEEVFSLTELAVEGTLDDDLWGAFEVEEVSAGQPFDFGESSGKAELEDQQPAGEFEVEEAFAFQEEGGADVFAIEQEEIEGESREFETGWEPVGEQTFTLEEESRADEFATFAEEKINAPVEESEIPLTTIPLPPAAEVFAQTPPSGTAAFVKTEQFEMPAALAVEQQFAPEEEYVPVLPVFSAPAQPAELNQELLTEAISRISREIIEKIVWEVVPDLAEAMIKEEIRKIKAGLSS